MVSEQRFSRKNRERKRSVGLIWDWGGRKNLSPEKKIGSDQCFVLNSECGFWLCFFLFLRKKKQITSFSTCLKKTQLHNFRERETKQKRMSAMENNKSLIMKSLILEYCTKMQGSSIQQNVSQFFRFETRPPDQMADNGATFFDWKNMYINNNMHFVCWPSSATIVFRFAAPIHPTKGSLLSFGHK